jgi:putative peptidoglycan lipid II flippase
LKLLKSTFTVGSATITSRILGFVRDMVFARYFGASGETDAFFLAFKIPNFMRRLFAEGSFSLAFVPVLSEVRAGGDRRALKDLIDHVSGTLAGILLVFTAIGVLAAPAVLAIFAPGWLIEGRPEFGLAADMLRITFPYILLISLTALAGGILNTFERFLIPALTPILLNISLILAAVVFSEKLDVPVKALAWGVLAAGIAQLLIQVPALMRLGVLPRPRWGWRHSGVRKILRLMIPTLVGSSVAQVNLLLDMVIATFLVSGSVTWLYYSDRLMEFPLGVFGVALSTVILPGDTHSDHAVPVPGIFTERCGNVFAQPVRLCGGFACFHCRESAGARILCPSGHQNTGQNSDHRDGVQYAAQLHFCRSTGGHAVQRSPYRPGARQFRGSLCQCRAALS